jgi:hypothetical protein
VEIEYGNAQIVVAPGGKGTVKQELRNINLPWLAGANRTPDTGISGWIRRRVPDPL